MTKVANVLALTTAILFSLTVASYPKTIGGPPMVSIVSVSPTSGTGNSPLNVTVVYSLTKSAGVEFWVDNVEVGNRSSPAGESSWSFTGLEGGYHSLGVSCAGNAQYKTYLVNPTITASARPGGTISPSGTIGTTYGGNQPFQITPNSGYKITGVYVDGTNIGAVSSYTFQDITSDHSITACFWNGPIITATYSGKGTLSPSGLVPVASGHDQPFDLLPEFGQYIVELSVDGTPQPGYAGLQQDTLYDFKNVTGNHTIQVTFSSLAGNARLKKPIGVTGNEAKVPSVFSLSQNYPNPFNPTTDITYQLPKISNVSIIVYNMVGQMVQVLANGTENAGYYAVTFNGSNLASGLYLLRLVATPQSSGHSIIRTMKMMLVK